MLSAPEVTTVVKRILMAAGLLVIVCCGMAAAAPDVLSFAALDSTNRFVSSGDGNIGADITLGWDYANLRRIANVNAISRTIHCDAANSYAIVGLNHVQLGYARQVHHVEMEEPGFEDEMNYHWEIMHAKFSPSRGMIPMPFKGNIVFGSLFYYEVNSAVDTQFTQPYVGVSYDLGGVTARAGWNWTRGDVTAKSGVFGAMQLQVAPGFTLYADYNERDANKILINKVILPRWGVDCSDCS
jgi:hypothetical protein